ncbi:MAG: MFS transporter, partial [Gemmatimonadales bacterium]
PGVLISLGLAVVGGVVFAMSERRAVEPIVPLHYLRRRNFAFPIAAQTFSNFAYIGAFFLAPLLLWHVYGYANQESKIGLLVLPRPIVFSVIAPVAGYVAVRVGERTSAVVGTAAVVASMAVFALAPLRGGMLWVEIAFVLSGVGLGVGQPPLSASVANEFEAEDLGAASASQQLMNQVGTVAGIQVMQTVQAVAAHGRSSPAALLPSFHLAYVVGGAVALFGVLGAACTRSTDRKGMTGMGASPAPSAVVEFGDPQPAVVTPAP